jgi:uncharacterized membrane protein YagU involved in acid resistance
MKSPAGHLVDEGHRWLRGLQIAYRHGGCTTRGMPSIPMRTSEHHHAARAIGSGIVAGLIAGVVLSVAMAVMNASQGRDVWQGLKFAGLPFLGERATAPGPDALAVAVGVGSHLLVSAVWGAIFGLLAFGARRAITVVDGALFGIVVWLGMFYVVMPIVGAAEARDQMPVAFAIAEHMFFGLVLGLAFLPFQRHIEWRDRPLRAVVQPSAT